MAKALKTLGLIAILLLLSFRLLQTPGGLTVDEASFGYNGVLLSKTLHDENGKYLPLFVLSIAGHDWRQPITQYFITGFFKLLPPSSFTLRFTSVIVATVSAWLLYKLSKNLFSEKLAFFPVLIFVTAPIIFMQSHLALDNIMPVPFVILWLFFIIKAKKENLGYLFLSGVSLGISLYSYKAMRIIVPPLSLVTIFYLYYSSGWNFKKTLNSILAFLSGVLPFFAIMPVLRIWYPGAISGGYQFHFIAWDNFFYPIISTFDPSFLFIKGDSTIYHSTGMHGMFLLATIPLFLIGIYQGIKKGGPWILIITSFFAVPLLFGLINSSYRASRLLAMVPSFVLICAFGVEYLIKGGRWLRASAVLILILVFLNFFNFARYYWYSYPKRYVGDFSQIKDDDYKELSEYAKKNNLTAYIEMGVYESDGEVAHFLEAAYFNEHIKFWTDRDTLPKGSVLLSYRDKIGELKRVDIKLPNYHLYVNQ